MTAASRLARRKRLLVLADFLENVVAARLNGAKFHMGEWGSTKEARTLSRADPSPVPSNIDATSECGFVGCAIGWAYYTPQLVKAGIRKHISGPKGFFSVQEEDIAELFGIEQPNYNAGIYSGTDLGEFEQCFMPAKRRNTGVSGIRRVVKVLRKTAGQAPPE